jgi:hypothetical protein
MSKYYRHLIEAGLLLDIYPNAAVAYSLRKLRSDYKKVFNLLTYSEDISQAVYSKSALITTSYTNVEIAPDGTITADKLIEDTSFASHFLTQQFSPLSVGLDYNFSVYLKAGERTKVSIQISGGSVRVNLLTGVIETNTTTSTPIVTNVGNGWWRFSILNIPAFTLANPLYRIFIVNALDSTSYVGDGVSGVYVWGFQLTQSSTLLPYEKTVVAPSNGNSIKVRRTSDNTDQDFGFDEINDTLTDWVGYNLWTYSEQMQQSVWTKTNLTVTTDTIVAPDGNTTGDVLFETTTNGVHSFQRALALTNGQLYTVSFWIKDEGRNHIRISTSSNFSQDGTTPLAWLDLSTGTIVSQTSGFTGSDLTITADGSWYKVSYTMPALSTSSITVLQLNLSPNGSNVSYVGDVTKGIAVWGLQISQTSTIKPYQKTEINAGGGGFVTTWYDQSGNGNNATQSTPANQAQIVLNGSLIIDAVTLKPTTTWTVDRYTLSPGINPNTRYLSIGVVNRTSNTGGIAQLGVASSIGGFNGQEPLYWAATTGAIRSDMYSTLSHGINISTGAFIMTSEKNASNLKTVYLNGSALPITATEAPAAGNNMNIWGFPNGNPTTCQYQEYIYWNSEQSVNRIAIETLINDYYAIF